MLWRVFLHCSFFALRCVFLSIASAPVSHTWSAQTHTHTRHTTPNSVDTGTDTHTHCSSFFRPPNGCLLCVFHRGSWGKLNAIKHTNTQCGHFPLELEHTQTLTHLHTHTIDGYSNGTKRTIRSHCPPKREHNVGEGGEAYCRGMQNDPVFFSLRTHEQLILRMHSDRGEMPTPMLAVFPGALGSLHSLVTTAAAAALALRRPLRRVSVGQGRGAGKGKRKRSVSADTAHGVPSLSLFRCHSQKPRHDCVRARLYVCVCQCVCVYVK